MTPSLYYNTVTPLLREILDKLMRAPELSLFRLVGGTSLSLRLGHRESVDIDMFTGQDYGTIDWRAIYELLRREFAYADNRIQEDGLHSFGESFYLGESEFKRVKVDLFYTDPFLQPAEQIDGIRMAAFPAPARSAPPGHTAAVPHPVFRQRQGALNPRCIPAVCSFSFVCPSAHLLQKGAAPKKRPSPIPMKTAGL